MGVLASDKALYKDEMYTFNDPSDVIEYFKSKGLEDETVSDNYEILLAFLCDDGSYYDMVEKSSNENGNLSRFYMCNLATDESEIGEG